MELHEKATGGKTNANKFQGLRMGSQRLRKPPWDIRKFNRRNNDEYLTILGVPLDAACPTRVLLAKPMMCVHMSAAHL